MYNTVFYIIVAIIIVNFILERYLTYLNTKHWKLELPEELNDVFEEEEYKKSQAYRKENNQFGKITSTFSFLLILSMLFFKGFAYVDNIARGITENPILVALIFFAILMLVSDILTTPFSYYATFVIEEKYGFNKTTVKTFILDKIKGWFLTAFLGGLVMAVIIQIYLKTGDMFWIYAWVVISGFSVFMNMFYSSIIVPLFNKQTPLEEGELREEIKKFAKNAGFKLDNIYVIDGSKRSSKANAYFAGLGPKKRVVLYDTLINDLETNEIVGVLAHEIGHYKLKHIISSMILSVIQTGLTLFILSLMINYPVLSEALGADQQGFHLGIIAFGILYSPISLFIGLGMNVLSRKNEYQADAFACNKYNGEALISALKKLHKNSLSNLTPHPLYVFFHYSHPTLLQRVQAIRKK